MKGSRLIKGGASMELEGLDNVIEGDDISTGRAQMGGRGRAVGVGRGGVNEHWQREGTWITGRCGRRARICSDWGRIVVIMSGRGSEDVSENGAELAQSGKINYTAQPA